MLYVLSYHFCRYLVAYCPSEVSVFPQFPSPQLSPHLWVFPKYRSRTQALESGDYLRNRKPRRERAEDMNVIRAYFHLFYCDVVVACYFLKHLSHALGNRSLQDVLAVLWRPYEMVCSVVGGVCCSSENHARIVANSSHLGIGHRALAKMVHPSPPLAAGHLEPFS